MNTLHILFNTQSSDVLRNLLIQLKLSGHLLPNHTHHFLGKRSNRHQTGIKQASNRHQTGIKQASNRHQTGIKQASNRHQTGIKQASNRHQTGIKQASNRHQTGIKQASNRHQTQQFLQIPQICPIIIVVKVH